MLYDGLARSERSGNSRHAALCEREKRVDNALSRHHGYVGGEFSAVRSSLTHRATLYHSYFPYSRGGLYLRYDVLYREIAAFDRLYHAVRAVRHHYLMPYEHVLVDETYLVARFDGVAFGDGGGERPFFRAVQSMRFDAARYPVAAYFSQSFERTLDTVVYAFDKPRSQFHRKRQAGAHHFVAGPDTRRFLVDLHRRFVAAQFDYLSYEMLFADAHDVVHLRVRHSSRYDKRSGNFNDSTHIYSFLSGLTLLFVAEKYIAADSFLDVFG